jgi:hypothetical protein
VWKYREFPSEPAMRRFPLVLAALTMTESSAFPQACG